MTTISRETDGRGSKVATALDAAVRLVGAARPRVNFSVAWMMGKFGQRVRVTWSTDATAESWCREARSVKKDVSVDFAKKFQISPRWILSGVRISNSCARVLRQFIFREYPKVGIYNNDLKRIGCIGTYFIYFLSCRFKILHGNIF